ncbi:hypothetical protein K490DRAFT_53124 [Saccharata proteae CBS 121410]|uniref:Uncharacterized protein n=1 Tax=Saccharata proteae CBS 121410 TaxID=1314787 RepID=A0A9P4I2S3_9PEZI|nr:hypothetical protein K490DRAFT_53124 [Saccharata proteae CBS 121410]
MGPPPPPPPPPPGMNQDCWGNVPPPPPPPGKRGKKMARDEIESVQGLMPPRGTTERVVRLSAVNTNRRAMLLHYAAAPFDLHENLWILKYGEANKWYTRPATSELERLRKFEDAGLGPDVRNWACHEPDCLHPAPSNMVKLQFGEVMGVADPDERQCWCGEFVEEEDTVCRFGKSCSKKRNVRDAISNELLVYLSVVEADKRDTDDDQDAADDMSFVGSTAKDDQCCDGSKIYKLEKTGSKNACAARAYQNAALRGWSTIFSCVIKGEVDLAKMSGGIKCFERVRNLGDLLGDAEGGKIKIFY